MHVSDIMTREVVSVAVDTPVREIARVLLQHGISAVPVLDADGVPIGMVSEGDLIQRDEPSRLSRRDWWLEIAAGETEADADFLARLRQPDRIAGDVMAAPVVTVSEDAGLTDVAALLSKYQIKRVPVVSKGRVVGIVSRADLLRALAADPAATAQVSHAETAHKGGGFLESVLEMFVNPRKPSVPHADQSHDVVIGPDGTHTGGTHGDTGRSGGASELTVNTFRGLVEDFHAGESRHHDEARRAAAQHREEMAKTLIDTHVSDATWQDILHRAREAASKGQTEYLLLRFPSVLCTDGGRAINVAEPDWPGTLRGEPAELYLRWERDLKNRGFGLTARVVEFPEGKPGDIGLFLVWGGGA